MESLKLPKDTMLGAAIVTITGNREAFIENYKGILDIYDGVYCAAGQEREDLF